MSVCPFLSALRSSSYAKNAVSLPGSGESKEFPGDKQGHPCDAVETLNRAHGLTPFHEGYVRCTRVAPGVFQVSGGAPAVGTSVVIERDKKSPLGERYDAVVVQNQDCAGVDRREYRLPPPPAAAYKQEAWFAFWRETTRDI